MFHVAAWTAQADPSGLLIPIAAARETALFTDGDILKIDFGLANLIGAAAIINDASATRAQLTTPSLLLDGVFDIEPLFVGGQFGSPPAIVMFADTPLQLEPGEFMRAYVQSDPAGAVRHHVIAWLADGLILPVKEPVFSVRCTASVAQQNFVWRGGALTFEQTLPVGRYVVLGLRCRASSGVLARLVFRNQIARPGVPIATSIDGADHEAFRFGNLGVWGSFWQEDPPQLEIFHGTAVSQQLLLDLVRF